MAAFEHLIDSAAYTFDPHHVMYCTVYNFDHHQDVDISKIFNSDYVEVEKTAVEINWSLENRTSSALNSEWNMI